VAVVAGLSYPLRKAAAALFEDKTMVDYNAALPQLQQYQAPNMLAMALQANQMQLHQAQLAEVQRAAQEQNQLRQLSASGVNLLSPEGIKQAFNVSPTLGLKMTEEANKLKTSGLNQELLTAQVGQIPLQNLKAQGEVDAQKQAAMAADHKLYSEMLNKVLALDDARAAPAYDMLRAGAASKYKDISTAWPATFDRGVLEKQMLTAEQAAQARAAERLAAQNKTTIVTGPGGVPLNFNKDTNTYVVGQPAATAAAAGAQPFAAPANTPAAVMRQPAAAPAVGDAYSRNLNAAEGVDKNSRSTARGFGQFINGTFVDTAKKVFPELANKSPAEILALRGTKLADGTPIEAALEQRFRTDNIASLTSAGIQPTPGNVYLAHFLGAGGARNVLSADPNTPLSQVVSADAIKANPEVLALRNKTVGDLQNWANSKFGGEPGLAASMTAGNARLGGAPTGFVPAGGAPMSPGAPTVNNALMANMFGAAPPQNAMLSLRPQIPGAPTPAPISTVSQVAMPTRPPATTIEELTARAGEAKLAEKGAQEKQTIQIKADADEAEKTKIREEFDKVMLNMIPQYQTLGRNQQLIVPGETSLVNRAKAVGSTLSPGMTTILSPDRAAPITTLSNLRQTMLSALMGATGLSSKNIDSNKEMTAYLDSLSNPGQPVGSIVDTLNNLSERFGTGRKITEKDLTGGKTQNPQSDTASATQRSGGTVSASPAKPAATSAGAIHPEAIAKLKANPSMAGQFDEIFGPGAAAKVLGR
jgi:hypothetical protein